MSAAAASTAPLGIGSSTCMASAGSATTSTSPAIGAPVGREVTAMYGSSGVSSATKTDSSSSSGTSSSSSSSSSGSYGSRKGSPSSSSKSSSGGSTSSPPAHHVASPQTMARQCTGTSRRTRVPGSTSPSSTSRFVALVTQFARTRPESSTRSSSGPYQVRRGWLGSSPVRRSSTLVAMLMGTSVVGAAAGAGVGPAATSCVSSVRRYCRRRGGNS